MQRLKRVLNRIEFYLKEDSVKKNQSDKVFVFKIVRSFNLESKIVLELSYEIVY